jgi:hypothetical protein
MRAFRKARARSVGKRGLDITAEFGRIRHAKIDHGCFQALAPQPVLDCTIVAQTLPCYNGCPTSKPDRSRGKLAPCFRIQMFELLY